MLQQFKVNSYKGKGIKLSWIIKTKDVKISSLWMRVDNASKDILQFDNMSDRPIITRKGEFGWTD